MNIFNKAIRHMSESIRRFIVVFAYTIVMYITYVIMVASDAKDLKEFMYDIMFGCVQGCFAAVLLRLEEERRHPNIPRQIRIAVLSVIPAIITTVILRCGYYMDKEAMTTCICVGVSILLSCAIMYLLASSTHESHLYALATKSVIFSSFVAVVIGIGLTVCTLAVDTLLFSVDGDVYGYIWAFVGIIIGINLLCSYIPRKDEELHIPRLFKIIIAYVLLPIFLLLIAVLFLYIGKIVITRHMPSGWMNWFASFALAAWVLFWMILRYIDSKIIQKYIRWGWILLVPIVIVQMIGVVIRLQTYGLTTARYISLICTILGVVAMVVAALGARPRVMIIIVAITTVIITITPLNVLDVPAINQYHRFTSLLAKYDKFDAGKGFVDNDATIPEEDAEKIYSSYSYLEYGHSSFGYVNFDIDKTIFHTSEGMSEEELYAKLNMEGEPEELRDGDDGNYYRTTYLDNELEYIDTTKTTRIRPIEIYLENGDYRYHEEFSDGTLVDVDLKAYVDAINTYCAEEIETKDSEGYLTEEQSSIEVDGGRIWVSEVSIEESFVTDTPDISIRGYYLEY